MRGVSIFRLRTVAKVGLDSGWVGAGYETHRVPSYDLDTSSDALEIKIGPSVWLLRCFEVIKPEPQKMEISPLPPTDQKWSKMDEYGCKWIKIDSQNGRRGQNGKKTKTAETVKTAKMAQRPRRRRRLRWPR